MDRARLDHFGNLGTNRCVSQGAGLAPFNHGAPGSPRTALTLRHPGFAPSGGVLSDRLVLANRRRRRLFDKTYAAVAPMPHWFARPQAEISCGKVTMAIGRGFDVSPAKRLLKLLAFVGLLAFGARGHCGRSPLHSTMGR